ncbi:PLP-dependent aminotransferase family protein [Isoptericola sp. F-RaC21]|uniref:aminotransferase-like domain-containing protein n=1 Tax=Isoptericola sp. F-RaC21 TaxID=3141452 RepID=UPI00315B6965
MATSAEADRVARLLGAWRRDDVPAHAALREGLTELVDGSHLPAGWRMPGQRELADALGIARGTVARAYADLTAQGRLVGRHGSGTYVRRAGGLRRPGEGRLMTFDDRVAPVVDLSSGALPGSEHVARVMPEVGRLLHEHHLDESGYHPAGLPELRAALAAELTARGTPTAAEEVMVTAGSQQAVWLVATALTGPGTLTVVEDPTYRGALEAFAGAGGRVRGVPFGPTGIDVGLLDAALASADLLYAQTSLHNPTGVHTARPRRRAIAEAAARHDVLVVDDQSQADLGWTRSEPVRGLDGLVDPARLLVLGTLSKLFWGGLRIGWVRGPREIVARLTDLRRGLDLGSPVTDQLAALLLLPRAADQRESRRAFLAERFAATRAVLRESVPTWRWWLPAGGSGLWVDTGVDAADLAGRALAHGVRLTPGPSFSPHGAHRTFVRLPVWHPQDQLAEAMAVVAELAGAAQSARG